MNFKRGHWPTVLSTLLHDSLLVIDIGCFTGVTVILTLVLTTSSN